MAAAGSAHMKDVLGESLVYLRLLLRASFICCPRIAARDPLGEVYPTARLLTVPVGAVAGNSDAVVAEAAFAGIPQSLDVLAEYMKVHLSTAADGFRPIWRVATSAARRTPMAR